MIGETVGHYRILEKIGAGGMGVVYRALDTHLNRPVAIKMLPAAPVADPERKRRFAQEAKAASALSHPNIVHIYDIDTAHGETFIAMEFVAGKSLDHLIGPRGLPLREALRYAVEIAGALAAAHSAGIVHRDLKPANIMVTDQKSIKVLDFGLAKLTEPAPAPGPDSPTLTMPPQTETGVIAGTAYYMSPEQAEGKPVDARSDIFSLGSVLYEMVTGRRAFSGDTVIATLSAILSAEPAPVRELVPGAPRELDRIIALCLRKDRTERIQHMGDLKILLQQLRDEVLSGAAPPGPQARGGTRFRSALAALCAAAVAAFFGIRHWQAHSSDFRMDYEFTRRTADAGLTTEPAISPDGRLIAYASDRSARGGLDIWVQHAGAGEPIQITHDETDDHEPSFSPDGSTIVFRSEREGGGIYVIPSLGGEPRLIAKQGHDPRFSPDGARIAYWTGAGVTVSAPSQIYIAPLAGGASRPAQSDLPFARHPVWTPDGKHLLFWGAGTKREMDWFVVPAEAAGKAVKTGFSSRAGNGRLTDPIYPAGWLGDKALFSARYGDSLELCQIALSPRNWQVTGPFERLTFGTGMESFPGAAVQGQLVFASLASSVNVWSLGVDGASGKVTGPLQQITYGADVKYRPSLSRDGRKLAFDLGYNVLVKDLGSGKETSLTTAGFYPSWSADGSKVAYSIGSRAKMQIGVVNAGGGVPETVCDDCGLAPAGWSSDGSKIIYDWGVPQTVGLLDLATGKKVELLRRPEFSVTQASFSPDDRWICFLAGVGPNRNRVYIIPFRAGAPAPPESEWIGVSYGESFEGQPRWSPEGNMVYFVSHRDGFRCIWAQRLDSHTKRPVQAAFAVYHFHSARRSLTNVGNVGNVGLGVSRDKLVFNLGELTGNVWMAKLQPRAVTPAQ